MMRQRIAAGVMAAGAAVPAMHYWRGLPWSLALIIGLAIGALGFLLVRAVQNLSAWRPRRDE
jgi:hypothetical protein